MAIRPVVFSRGGADASGGTPSPSRAITWLLGIVALAPAAFLVSQVTHSWVDVPFADDWAISDIVDKYFEKAIDCRLLFAQHNESRKVFPRLIILGLALVGGYRVRWQMGLTMAFAGLISAGLYLLLRRTFPSHPIRRLALYAICNLFLFTPAQWLNWLSGIQFCVFIPPLMLTAALLVNGSGAAGWTKTLCAAAASFVATYSYANGMLLWALACPGEIAGLRAGSRPSRGGVRIQRALYVALAIASIALYAHDYHAPPQSPPMTAVLRDPVGGARFLLAWVGGPLASQGSRHSDEGAILLGILLLVPSIAGFARTCAQGTPIALSCPWLVLCAYSLLTGVATTLGRAGDGIAVARVSRYPSFSIYLPLAGAVLLARSASKPWHRISLAGWLSAVMVFHEQALVDHVAQMRSFGAQLRNARCALRLSSTFLDEGSLAPLHPDLTFLLDRFHALARMRMLAFSPVDPAVLDWAHARHDAQPCGWLDSCVFVRPDAIECTGWAFLFATRQPATNVVLTWEGEEGPVHPFALGFPTGPRPDLARELGRGKSRRCGFRVRTRLPQGLPGRITLRAWTIDPDHGVAYPLRGPRVLRVGRGSKDDSQARLGGGGGAQESALRETDPPRTLTPFQALRLHGNHSQVV